MDGAPVSYYSVLRYVADPIRDEPKNIGVIVVASDSSAAWGRFALSRSGLPPASPRYRFLRSIVDSFRVSDSATLDHPRVDGALTLARLRELHQESTNLIQFTAPLPAPGEARALLDAVYKDFVAPRQGGTSANWSRGAAVQAFRKSFRPFGMEAWVKDSATVALDGQPPFVFDLGVGNGHWRALIENASFRSQDIQKPEERAAWMTLAWRTVRDNLHADALLFIERVQSTEAEARFRRVKDWAKSEGIKVCDSRAAPEIAKHLAEQLTAQPATQQAH